jgi:hypothetical protein
LGGPGGKPHGEITSFRLAKCVQPVSSKPFEEFPIEPIGLLEHEMVTSLLKNDAL